jgi:hypothetical protein
MTTTADFSFLLSDPVVAQMMTGEVYWGDLCMNLVPEVATVEEEPARELPADWDLDFPVLRLRKDIWENFPVIVNPLGAGSDGAERHAICWHRRNFEEWRNTRTSDGYEAMDYESITEHRLITCLEASKSWTVEDPVADGQLCVIRMNFVPKTESAEEEATAAPAVAPAAAEDGWTTVGGGSAAAAAPAPRSTAPLLTRLNDIKIHFPVVWHKIEDARTRTAVYALEIFGKKIVEMSRASGKTADAVRAEVEANLMTALRASPAWRVLRSEGREFCRLEMA